MQCAQNRSGDRERVVVVGHGMVGHRFCERLLDLDAGRRFEICVRCEEPRAAYDRVHLSEFFSGRSAEDLALTTPAWYAERGVALELAAAVVTIDPAMSRVTTRETARACSRPTTTTSCEAS